jgi:hypothetical protein
MHQGKPEELLLPEAVHEIGIASPGNWKLQSLSKKNQNKDCVTF